MRMSDWSSDVCSSDLLAAHPPKQQDGLGGVRGLSATWKANDIGGRLMDALAAAQPLAKDDMPDRAPRGPGLGKEGALVRSEEHTSELQSLMRISYAVFCLKKKKKHTR